MSPIHFLSKSRGTRNLVSRIKTVLGRFGFSPKKFERLLNRYITIAHDLGFVPTFAITAVILKRHQEFARELSQQGVEFAVHGYVHIDYMTVSLDEQTRHFKEAIKIFKVFKIPFICFRAPFLRINGHTSTVLGDLGFLYDSSHVIHWDIIDLNEYSKYERINHDRLLEFYQPRGAKEYLALPRFINGFIEIPVSIPDDEALVDRLCITDGRKISEIWRNILESTYSRGELFTIQLHPERISYCENALKEVIQQAKELNPTVWVAALREIAEWWQERDKFAFRLHPQDEGGYRVQAECTERATVLLKNCKANVPVNEWFDGYQSIAANNFVLDSPKRPIIGVSRESSPSAVRFLRNEGYIVEQSDHPDDYSIYFNNLGQFDEAHEKPLSQEIERSDAPLLRYWRWPNQARSALSVTGDIDSITLCDFVLRVFENWRQNWR
jgi:peptidoglycan/xylan/chitin deacetylase (PgdA/CDA1 family)